MGRPNKNPDNALVRLRAALSTESHEVTRQDLSKRTGIPYQSLRDIETGKYKMTRAIALQIAYATGASAESLWRNEMPLLDMAGNELSPKSPDLLHLAWSWQKTKTLEALFSSIMLITTDKTKRDNVRPDLAIQIGLSFVQWANEVTDRFGLEGASVFEELKWKSGFLGFDPNLIPRKFWLDQIKQLPIPEQIRINAAHLPKAPAIADREKGVGRQKRLKV